MRPPAGVHPGRGPAAPWSSGLQPSSANNFPTACRIPAEQIFSASRTCTAFGRACGAASPSPGLQDHNEDAIGATLGTRNEQHHG